MQLEEIIIDFKKSRTNFKKVSVNVSVNEKRLKNMTEAIGNQCFFFKMLNKSEQFDFLLEIAEKSLSNSNLVDLEITK